MNGTFSTAKAEKEWAEIARNLRTGESTGDRLKDFVLARYPTEQQKEMESLYRGLEALLCPEQPALVVVRREVPLDHDGRLLIHIPMDKEKFVASTIAERLYLGIVSGTKLVFQLDDPQELTDDELRELYPTDSCEIPTGRRRAVACSWELYRPILEKDNVEATNSFPHDWTWDLTRNNKPLAIKSDRLKNSGREPGLELEVVVGLEAYNQWLERNPSKKEIVSKMSAALLSVR